MENKTNNVVIIIAVVILLAVMFVVGWFLGGKFNALERKASNDVRNSANDIIDMAKDTINEAVDTIKNEGLTEEEFYSKVKGTWYYTDDKGGKYGLSLTNHNYDNVDVRFYSAYQCYTEGGSGNIIFSFKYLGNNVYQIYSYSEGCNGDQCIIEKDPSVNKVLIDISGIDNKTIKVRNEDSANKEVVYNLWESDKHLCE